MIFIVEVFIFLALIASEAQGKEIRSHDHQHQFRSEFSLSSESFESSNLSYPHLSSSKYGRHLLLVSLLEELHQPFWFPRSDGSLKLFLPPSLAPADQPPPPPTSQVLREVETADGKIVTRDEIVSMMNVIDDFKILPGEKFSRFKQYHMEVVKRFVNMLTSQVSFDSLFSILVMLKEFIPIDMFVDAVYSLIQRRKDVGFIVPSAVSVQPEDYFPGELLESSFDNVNSSHRVRRQSIPWAKGRQVDVNLNDPRFKTMPDSEPESKLWYFRENPNVNANHYHWHQVLSNDEVTQYDNSHSSKLDRRGEMFYFMHRQLLCRENLERLSVGLKIVEPYGPDQWYEKVYPGYDSKLGFGSVKKYAARPDGAEMFHSDARKLKMYEDLIRADVKWGYLVVKEGYVKLEYVGGVDRGISTLGDVIESYVRSKYGDLHNSGHSIISDLHKGKGDGVMGTPNVAVRDPIFGRFHKYIDDLFLEYKNLFGPYTDQDLGFPGVQSFSVTVKSDRASEPNYLYTHMNRDASVQLSSLDLGKAGSSSVLIHYTSLDHDPFTYNLKVHSTWSSRGIIRIFLMPAKIPSSSHADITQLAVELDRFHVELAKGQNTITRKSQDSSFLAKKRSSLYELQKMLRRGVITQDQFNWGGCGWPTEMLLPRGQERGMEFDLFAVVSPLLQDDNAHQADWNTHNTGTWSWCGVRTDQGGMPDSRPMGFPLDRSPPNGDWRNLMKEDNGQVRSNMVSVKVSIVHSP
eukprot:GFUD01027941.1.p1 GENE.GFUD01027941.1~~GFUD01027941.1.p1  ORF type:complete len:745 (-),score=133.69 GFUD01027941.1:49-2283(-)